MEYMYKFHLHLRNLNKEKHKFISSINLNLVGQKNSLPNRKNEAFNKFTDKNSETLVENPQPLGVARIILIITNLKKKKKNSTKNNK